MADKPAWTPVTHFILGEKVYLDGHDDIEMIVTGLLYRYKSVQAAVSWFASGVLQEVYIDIERLERIV